MENNSQIPAPATPTKVMPPAKEPHKTTQASSNHEVVVPMAARTAATVGSAGQAQRGTAVGSVQQQTQPLSSSRLQVFELAGTGTRSMFGTTAHCGATMPRSPTSVRSLASKPKQQTNPVVFGPGSSSSNQAIQGSSSTQAAVAATALAAATHGPTAQHGAAVPSWLPPAALGSAPRVVRQTKLKIKRPRSPPPPKLPVYRRRPPPPRPELDSSSGHGDALLQSSSGTGFRVSNMQANTPSPGQVTMAEEGSDSKDGGGSRDDVKMLDLNFPPVSDEEN